MTNSVNASPKDWSNLNAGSMSMEELEALLADEPTSRSMPLLLASFGPTRYGWSIDVARSFLWEK